MKRDKVKHLIAGIILGLLGTFIHPYLGVGAAIVAGGAKEIWDSRGNGTPELMDFIYTVAGGALGSIVIIIGGLI